MVQEEQVTTPRALWMLVIAGPVILAAEMQANFVLVPQACSMQRSIALYGVVVLAMLLAIATAVMAISMWRRAGATWRADDVDLASRIRFIALLGFLGSVMSFIVILAQGIATVHFDPCQL